MSVQLDDAAGITVRGLDELTEPGADHAAVPGHDPRAHPGAEPLRRRSAPSASALAASFDG
jgi:hypothetical protein